MKTSGGGAGGGQQYSSSCSTVVRPWQAEGTVGARACVRGTFRNCSRVCHCQADPCSWKSPINFLWGWCGICLKQPSQSAGRNISLWRFMDLQELSVQGGYNTRGKSQYVTVTFLPAKGNASTFLFPSMFNSHSLSGRKREERYSPQGQLLNIHSRENQVRINKKTQWNLLGGCKCGRRVQVE